MTIQRLLLILAVVLFLIAGLDAAGWINASHEGAWIAFGLAAFAAAHL